VAKGKSETARRPAERLTNGICYALSVLCGMGANAVAVSVLLRVPTGLRLLTRKPVIGALSFYLRRMLLVHFG
jgi:hypothetical protein